jgi:cell division protein FtsI/penicillin-binding protein 2
MVTIKHLVLLPVILLLPLSSRGGRLESADRAGISLFAQSAAEALNQGFPGEKISFLLFDARTGQMLASKWEHPETPIPLGSLAKPFAALAYGERHNFQYPTHVCGGSATGCWRPGGHGAVNLTAAIAYSCNSYFRTLTADLTAADVLSTASRFGLEQPERETSGMAFAELGSQWRISPLRMARAYLELLEQKQNPAVSQILGGLAASARQGTGAAVDRALRFPNALAKTGTAACTHSPHAPGDGFTVALSPADDPKILLMVRIHGVPGAQAAETAGQMLRRIEE